MTKMDLVLHIGTEKTGTTLLQKWLYSNRPAFSEAGIFLSERLEGPNNRKIVTYFHADRDDYWNRHGLRDAADKDRHFDGFIEAVEAELREAEKTHRRIVITSEHFHSRLRPDEIAAFAAFCARNFGDVRILCYLRPQWDVRKSLYSNAAKGAGSREFSEFQCDLTEDSPYYNYHDLYHRWRAGFPGATMDFRLYDRKKFPGGDIRRDLLTAVAPDMDPARLDLGIDSANESVRMLRARAYLAVNRKLPLFPQGGMDRRNMAYKRMLDRVALLDRGAFHDERARAVHDLFHASNMALSREIFDGGDLFGEPDDGPPAEETMTLGEVAALVEEIVGVLVEETCGQMLLADEIDLLRDVAFGHETGAAPGRQEAVRLLQIVQRARPDRQLVRRKLREWTAPPAGDAAAG